MGGRGQQRSRIPLVVLGNPGKRKGPVRCFRHTCAGKASHRLEHLEQCLIHPQLWAAACKGCAQAVKESLERYSLTFPPYALCSVCCGVNGRSQLTLFSNGEALLWVCKYCNVAQKNVLQANLFLRQESVPPIESVESIVTLAAAPDAGPASPLRKRTRSEAGEGPSRKTRASAAEQWQMGSPRPSHLSLAVARSSLDSQPIANMAEFAKLLENFREHDALLTKLVISHREQYSLLLNLSNRIGAASPADADERLRETNAMLLREVEMLRNSRSGAL